jgi:hypothetical protein
MAELIAPDAAVFAAEGDLAEQAGKVTDRPEGSPVTKATARPSCAVTWAPTPPFSAVLGIYFQARQRGELAKGHDQRPTTWGPKVNISQPRHAAILVLKKG